MLIAVIAQLNDYSYTLDPYVQLNVGDDQAVSFVGIRATLSNLLLIYLKINILSPFSQPDLGMLERSVGQEVRGALYQLVLPFFVALGIIIPITLSVKQQDKYQNLAENFTNFDIALVVMAPILGYLVAETLQCSGLMTLIVMALFQSVYTRHNLERHKQYFVLNSYKYISYLFTQIGFIICGVILPFYFERTALTIREILLYLLPIIFSQLAVTLLIHKTLWRYIVEVGEDMGSKSDGRGTFLGSIEQRTELIQSVQSKGLLMFTLGFSIQNNNVTMCFLCYMAISVLVLQPISILLIQNYHILDLSRRGDERARISSGSRQQDQDSEATIERIRKERTEEADSQREGHFACFSRLKKWVVDVHIDKIYPFLVRQST
mmetsp:Transcript_4691/g.7991  ORF Transcript_4691/g.7991 Transcript_4691/m.7991 type:complete len:378 (-) Transcript_4691:509-1642(-)